jgi:hypothetical protein
VSARLRDLEFRSCVSAALSASGSDYMKVIIAYRKWFFRREICSDFCICRNLSKTISTQTKETEDKYIQIYKVGSLLTSFTRIAGHSFSVVFQASVLQPSLQAAKLKKFKFHCHSLTKLPSSFLIVFVST